MSDRTARVLKRAAALLLPILGLGILALLLFASIFAFFYGLWVLALLGGLATAAGLALLTSLLIEVDRP